METAASKVQSAQLEWLGLAAWFLVAIVGGIVGRGMAVETILLMAFVWLAVLAIFLRRGLMHLFGPVLFYEMIRLSRTKSSRVSRVFFAMLLAIVFAFIYYNWSRRYDASEVLPISAQARLAENFFFAYAAVQYLFVIFFTPGFVAGAITEEKERKTLEFILATDLRNREIIFGKLAARVGNVAFFLLAGLPVLSMIQFFGGVEPAHLLAAFVVTFITLISLSCLSIYCSVSVSRTRDAITLAYLVMGVYFVLSLICEGIRPYLQRKSFTIPGLNTSLDDLAYSFSIGNPIVGMSELERRSRTAGTSGLVGNWDLVLQIVGHYALFHGIFIFLYIGLSMLRLRAAALKQEQIKERKANHRRPPIGDLPMRWKEVRVEGGLKMALAGRIAVWLLVLINFGIPAYIAYETFFDPPQYYGYLGYSARQMFTRAMHSWVQVSGTIVATLVLIAVAVRGAGSIRREKDKQTYDELVMTPLTSHEILWGKWWGCMLGMRKAWYWIGSIWLVGMFTGGVHFIMVPFLVLAMVVFASAFAWIGIWFSIVSDSSPKATLATIFVCVAVGGAYLLTCCVLPAALLDVRRGDGFSTIFQVFTGLSPIGVMAWLPMSEFRTQEIAWIDRSTPFVPFAVIGLIVWWGIAYWLSNISIKRLDRDTNRNGSNAALETSSDEPEIRPFSGS